MTSVAKLLMTEPPLFTAATAVYPYSPDLERKFKAHTSFGDPFQLSRRQGDLLQVPRALCPVANDDRRDPGQDIEITRFIEPRDAEQHRVFHETLAFLQAGMSGQVSAPTGMGKTALALFCAAELKKKFLVVVTKEDLLIQWIEEALKFTSLERKDIGIIQQDKCEVKGKKMVVALIHSLSLEGRYPDWIVDGFGLVIWDECHRLPADQFLATAGMIPARLRLGLSATNNRADGKEVAVQAHIGPIRVKGMVEQMVPRVFRFTSPWVCPKVTRKDPETGQVRIIKLPHGAGKTGLILKKMIKDPLRNKLLVDLVETAFEKNRKTVFFSDSLDHLKIVHAGCLERGIPKANMSFYVGGMKKDARDLAKTKGIIFSTFAMMSEGTSIDWLDLVILGSPRSNVVQPVGRVRRIWKDKPQPVVFDVIDADSPVFAGYSVTRLTWYKKIGAVVENM